MALKTINVFAITNSSEYIFKFFSINMHICVFFLICVFLYHIYSISILWFKHFPYL